MKTGTNRRRRKKIGYVPGIISAVLLPVVFYFFAERHVQNLSVAVIPFIYFDTTHPHYDCSAYFLPQRNYTNIIFNGNGHDDQIKLDLAQITIREIIRGNDTTNALHFVFTNSSHYGTMVDLLDKLRIEDARFYIFYKKDVWFFTGNLKSQNLLNTTVLLDNDVIKVQPETAWWAAIEEKLGHVWHSSWQIIVLFFCFTASLLFLRWKKRD